MLYHRVNTEKIPENYASVPVTVDDNGVLYKTRMLAGLVGIESKSSGWKTDGAQYANHAEGKRLRRRIEKAGNVTLGLDQEYGIAKEEETEEIDRPPSADQVTNDPGRDTLSPAAGWWIYEVETDEETGKRKEERKSLIRQKRAELAALGPDAGNEYPRAARGDKWWELIQELAVLEQQEGEDS